MYFCFFIVLCLLFIDVSLITQHDKKRLFMVIHSHSIVIQLFVVLLFIVYCSPHPRPLSNWRGEWAFNRLFGILMVLQCISMYFNLFLNFWFIVYCLLFTVFFYFVLYTLYFILCTLYFVQGRNQIFPLFSNSLIIINFKNINFTYFTPQGWGKTDFQNFTTFIVF